jgi:hypothetical protein
MLSPHSKMILKKGLVPSEKTISVANYAKSINYAVGIISHYAFVVLYHSVSTANSTFRGGIYS